MGNIGKLKITSLFSLTTVLFYEEWELKDLLGFRGLLVFALFFFAATRVFAEGGLHILLTNDDGFDSKGLMVMRDHLEAHGHSVSVVAPLAQRSGTGMKITIGPLPVRQEEEKVWSIDASPADAVSFALKHLLVSRPPDLVISGANFGQNLGAIVFSSGTVGAAMMAALLGKPAIAVSVGIFLEEEHATPNRFPSTLAAFPAAAEFTANLVDDVAGLLVDGTFPPDRILNINYPALNHESIKGAVWVSASRFPGFELVYPVDENGGIRSWIKVSEDGLADSQSDTGKFSEGFVTLSWLTPDWNSRPFDSPLGLLSNPETYLRSP